MVYLANSTLGLGLAMLSAFGLTWNGGSWPISLPRPTTLRRCNPRATCLQRHTLPL